MDDCIFCKIAQGEAPAHVIWEDEAHMAFLSIFPNTSGFSVVIPKEHHPSYIFGVTDEVRTSLIAATKIVASKIDTAFEDVGRTGLIFEGFGVNHLHAKLSPMHGTNDDTWKQRASSINTYFETYQGYISSHDAQRAEDADLAKLAEKIKNAS